MVGEGQCWRCDQPVQGKDLEQWFFRITQYAEELLDWCEKLPGWPEKVLTMQRNWIGKSSGTEIEFPLEDGSGNLTVFTTRPDTLFGATFMSLAVEHPLVQKFCLNTPQEEQVKAFVKKVQGLNRRPDSDVDLEKEGVFTGAFCINPMTQEKMPIFVANFVLMGYGTGAVMAVPTHDQRDFEFARKYDLPLRVVIQPEGQEPLTPEL